MHKPLSRITVAFALLLAALGWAADPVPSAHAATSTVSVCDESHLRAAIGNAAAGGTVNFGCNGTITLTSGGGGPILLSQNLTIDGGGQSVTISGGNSVQILFISGTPHVTLNQLTIANGNNLYTGGAIYSTGTLSVINSTFSDNTASNGAGGGIENAGGTLIVSNSTFSGNSANSGGGIYNNGGALAVTNSTFSGNSASAGYGGGIEILGGTLTVTNSTFSGNSAGFNGGGIEDAGGTLTVSNSTFSGNSAGTSTLLNPNKGGGGIEIDSLSGSTATVSNSTFSGNSAHLAQGGGLQNQGSLTLTNTLLAGSPTGGDCAGTSTDNGGNLADDTSCGFTQSSSKGNVTTLNLASLANNGGPLAGAPASADVVQTIALLPGSSAIGAGVSSVCTAAPISGKDQRGFLRGTVACDSGAYDTGANIAWTPTNTLTNTPTNTPVPTDTPTNTPVPPTATSTSTPGAAAVLLSPTLASPFQTLALTGTNFDPGEAVRVYWDSTSTTPLITPTTSAAGSFSATLRVPQAVAGGHPLFAVGQSSGWLASTMLQVKPALVLVPSAGRAGSLVNLVGVGFGPTETVEGLWYPGSKLLGGGRSTALGTLVLTFTVPLSATGSYAVVGYGLSSKQAAVAGFTLTALAQVQRPPDLARPDAVALSTPCTTAVCWIAVQAVRRAEISGRAARRKGGPPPSRMPFGRAARRDRNATDTRYE